MTLFSANKSLFTNREIRAADQARYLYRRLGFPWYKRCIKAVKNNSINNCTVTIDDIKRSLHIYGPADAGMKGKTTRRKSKPIGNVEVIPLPPEVLKHHKVTMLSVDYIYVHGLVHFHSIDQGYCHKTIKYVKGKKATSDNRKSCIKNLIKVCRNIEIDVK